MKIVRLLNLYYHPFNLNYASSVVTYPKKCVLTNTHNMQHLVTQCVKDKQITKLETLSRKSIQEGWAVVQT